MNNAVAIFIEWIGNYKWAGGVALSRKQNGVTRIAYNGEKTIAIWNQAFVQCFVVDGSVGELESLLRDNYSRELY